MDRLRIAVLLLSVGFIAGCNLIQAGKLVAPESFGLMKASPDIYVEVGADEVTRAGLRDAMERAEKAIRAAYGSVNSRPVVYACISEGCYKSFGGATSVAKI